MTGIITICGNIDGEFVKRWGNSWEGAGNSMVIFVPCIIVIFDNCMMILFKGVLSYIEENMYYCWGQGGKTCL